MRQVYAFFKICNAQQCLLFPRFVRFSNMKLFCKSETQNKNNFMFKTLTKHVKNQTNCRIALEKLKKIWICLIVKYVFSCNPASCCLPTITMHFFFDLSRKQLYNPPTTPKAKSLKANVGPWNNSATFNPFFSSLILMTSGTKNLSMYLY